MPIGGLQLSLPPQAASLRELGDAIEGALRSRYDQPELVLSIVTAVHEIVANVINHAAPRSEIEVAVTLGPHTVRVEIVDDGRTFEDADGELASREDGDPAIWFAQSARSGRGLALTQTLVDKLTYSRAEGRNRWVLEKRVLLPVWRT